MKKLFTAMAAIALFSTAVFAQDERISFSPNEESVNGFDFSVEVSIDISGATKASVQFMSGNGFTQNVTGPKMLDLNDGKINLDITKELWGDSFDGTFGLKIFVIPLDEDEVPFEDEDGEPLMGVGRYTYSPQEAIFVKSIPNNKWLHTTFADSYGINEFKLYFSREVILEDVLGTITYVDLNGKESWPEEIESADCTAEWDYLDGMYVISFPYASRRYRANQLSKIIIDIDGVNADVPVITLDNTPISTPQQRVVKDKKSLEAGLAISSETVNVYSVQGTLVKKNASDLSSLQPGLYIVDGKKVVVK